MQGNLGKVYFQIKDNHQLSSQQRVFNICKEVFQKEENVAHGI